MPPKTNGVRASSRLRSVPPETKQPPISKSISKKRAASVAVDGDSEQPKKRSRGLKHPPPIKLEAVVEDASEEKEDEPAPPSRRQRKPASKAVAEPPPAQVQAPAKSEKTKPKLEKEKPSTLARGSRTKAINAVPEPASHPRPPRLAFVFGTGDFGQFGLGTETLDEIARPRLHAWFETAAKNNTLGSEGAGLEMICAGGMHSLAIDEVGKVSFCAYIEFISG